MTVDPVAEQARAVMHARLRRGVKASPLCRAVMGWLCEAATSPAIADIRRTPEGRIWLRLSDEAALEPLCSFLEFLDQIRIVCESLQMTDDETRQMVAWARQRLG